MLLSSSLDGQYKIWVLMQDQETSNNYAKVKQQDIQFE